MKIYVCEMLRFGSRENHSYIKGVYSTPEEADNHGQLEATDRGGKYEYVVYGYDLDQGGKRRYISGWDENISCNKKADDCSDCRLSDFTKKIS